MPRYSYQCEVCATKVNPGLENCPTCGCPAQKNTRELNWYKKQWQISDKSGPINSIATPYLPFCVWTSVGILFVWFWVSFIHPLRGTSGDIGYLLMVQVILLPLAIGGVISGYRNLRNSKDWMKVLMGVCFVFSLIIMCIVGFNVLLFVALALGALS